MNVKELVIGVVLSLLIGIGIGRYTLPAKIISNEIDNKNIVTNVAQTDNSVQVVTKIQKPDGTVITTTKIDKHVDTNTTSKEKDTTEKHKEIVYDAPKWSIAALASTDFRGSVAYGGSASYRIIGPINVGVFGLTSGVAGVSFGISF